MRSQTYAIILAPILLFVIMGFWNMLLKQISKGNPSKKRTYFEVVKRNNIHLFFMVIVLDEWMSRVAFGGLAPTGLDIPDFNNSWSVVRSIVFLWLTASSLKSWSKYQEKAAEPARAHLLLAMAEFLALIMVISNFA